MITNWVPFEVRVTEFSPFRYKFASLVVAYVQFFGFIALITLVARLVWNA